MDQDLVRRYRWFRAKAGYVVGERAREALQLAKAERRASQDDSVRFRWESDPCPDLSWASDEEQETIEEVCICLLESRCGSCSHWETSQCLGGIVNPSMGDATRLYEAELALEHYAS